MFWGKNKEEKQKEKILNQMKEKKAQIDKLKEEMNNMAKLVLKDGKLQKVEDGTATTVLPPPPTPPSEINTQSRQPQQYAPEPQYAPQRQQQYAPEPQYAPQQQQMRQPQFQEMYEPRMQQPVRQFVPPPLPPQPINIEVTIELTSGKEYKTLVSENDIEIFTNTLNNAIVNESLITIGSTFVSGRHIVSYTFE